MAGSAITTTAPVALPRHELLARVFRTLGDPTRLRVVRLLGELGEATQTELIEQTGTVQSRMSAHLSCLTWCGFVVSERRGRTVRYRLADGFAERFLALASQFLSQNEGAVGSCVVLKD